MITNPKIDQRVIIIALNNRMLGRRGRIYYISNFAGTIGIEIDGLTGSNRHHFFYPDDLRLEVLTSEEQDKLNREQYADKYL